MCVRVVVKCAARTGLLLHIFLNVSKPTHSSVYRVPLLKGVFTKGTSTLQSLEDKAQQPSIYGFLRAGAAACQGQEAVQLDYEQRTFISSQGSLHISDHHLTVQTDHTLPSTCRLIRIHVADQRFKSSGDAEFPHGWAWCRVLRLLPAPSPSPPHLRVPLPSWSLDTSWPPISGSSLHHFRQHSLAALGSCIWI